MPTHALPILIQAEEAVSQYHHPPPTTKTAIFTIPYAYAMSLAVGKVVQLKISSAHALVDDYQGDPAGPSANDGLITLPIAGPVVGVRMWDEQGMEFVVRNDFPGTQITQAHLRVPRAVEPPARETFARELASRLQELLESKTDKADKADPTRGGAGPDAAAEGAAPQDTTHPRLVPDTHEPAPPSEPHATSPLPSATRWPADANRLTANTAWRYRPRISSPLATKGVTPGS